MVTIKDIAKECGVSIATVSNIVNGKKKAGAETEKRVKEAVSRLGYTPNNVAKGLRSRRSGLIGVIVEDICQFTVPPIVESIVHHLEDAGMQAVIKNLRLYSRWSDSWFHDESMVLSVTEPAFKEFEAHMVDGVIYVGAHMRNVSIVPENYRVPVIMSYSIEKNPDITSVVIDEVASGCEAMNFLIRNGHRRIGILAGLADNLHTILRLEGAKKALEEAGIGYDPALVVFAGWQRDDGYRGMPELLEKGITSVFCMADRVAGGVYLYLYSNGLEVGKKFSVMSYDKQDISEFFVPTLATMALPLSQIGEQSVKLLLEKLSGETPDAGNRKIIKIPSTLVKGDSVQKYGV